MIDPDYESVLSGLAPWSEATLAGLPGAQCVKAAPGRLVYRVPRGGQVFYFKRYRPRRWWRRFVPTSKGRRERLITEAAHARGLPVPRLAAYAEQAGDAFLVLTEVGPQGHLVEVLRKRRTESGATLLNSKGFVPRQFLRRLAEFVADLHEKGFVHDDLSALHIRLDEADRFYLIDLDHGRFLSRVPDVLRLHNLLQLYRSMTRLSPRAVDVYRFFRYYCERVPAWRGREKLYWRRLAKAMDYRTRSARGLFFRARYAMILRGWTR